jgi:CRP-like cAMP-binding protein
MKVIKYTDKERIIKSGDIDRKMYIILRGSVRITLTEGKDQIEVALLNKGDFFGEMSLFSNMPRSATATAVGDVELTFIRTKEQLTDFLEKNPKLSSKMVHILASRLAKTNQILLNEYKESKKLRALLY